MIMKCIPGKREKSMAFDNEPLRSTLPINKMCASNMALFKLGQSMRHCLALTIFSVLVAAVLSHKEGWDPGDEGSFEMKAEDHERPSWQFMERRKQKFEDEEPRRWRPQEPRSSSEEDFKEEREVWPRHHKRHDEEEQSSEENIPPELSSDELGQRRHHRPWSPKRHHGRWHPWHRHHRRHFPFRRHHRRRGCKGRESHHRCPKMGAWQESTCLWPGQETKIPESCHANFSHFLPKAVAEYYKSKAQEFRTVVETLFKKRGISKACGFCSKKIACRKRKAWKKHGCRPVEFAFVKEECQGDNNACELTLVDGGCPAPMPQKMAVKHNKFIAKHRHFRHKGPMEFHERRFGFEQSHVEWNEEEKSESSSESSSGEPSENEETSTVSPVTNSTDGTNSSLRRMARSAENDFESGARHHHDKRYSPFIPLWHCVKSKQGDKCFCCCGGYFPDAATGKCTAVEGGNRFPPVPMAAW